MTVDDEVPERNRCSCGGRVVLVNGRPTCLSKWLANRPTDDDPWAPTDTQDTK